MRRLCLLALLTSPLAFAETSVTVETNSFIKLPALTGTLNLDRVVIADHGTLVVPVSITEIKVGDLRMGRDARIGIASADQPFRLEVARGEIATGGHITASGAAGSMKNPASEGRDLTLRLGTVAVDELTVDVRGGIGAPGYSGLAGADGKPGGCLWGQASRGHDGQNGGNGGEGGNGGHIRLEVAQDFPLEQVRARVEGGAGGPAGEAGAPGAGGAANGCLIYSTDRGQKGRAGQPGQAGPAGTNGRMDVVRY
ncbi:collagen-like protein [Metapseudomonas otitidis]|uniref:collagen-like protein n=1 Tax=Metapseudomonas otitidis TaxID=319939 RepID=UPI0013F66A5A|nr:collagen-like protein [Pseudomonas otitidis]